MHQHQISSTIEPYMNIHPAFTSFTKKQFTLYLPRGSQLTDFVQLFRSVQFTRICECFSWGVFYVTHDDLF